MQAARDTFENPAVSGLPVVGAKVLLAGFTGETAALAHEALAIHGLKVTSFSSSAEAVLVPPNASEAVLAEARKSGRRIVRFEELGADRAQAASAFEVTEESVRVLDVTLPRRAERDHAAPSPALFAHLCFDGTFLRTARTVALAAREGVPCALEGETAAAKTTAVLWLAALLGQGVARVNLHGQSDTGELVGRFVPATTGFEGGQARAQWRFAEGHLPRAMRAGHWLLLDEVNLAEPQVLERLNSALESPPTLVLSEHEGLRFGEGGDVPVSRDFRVFATMNPAEYAGRSVLSPAFRDRFGLWSFAETPGEAEVRAMLRALVYGEHPEFAHAGRLWRAPATTPLHGHLAQVPGIEDLLARVASFHASVGAASGPGAEVGRTRRERYVFTRRTLLTAAKLFAASAPHAADPKAALREALEQVYVERVQPGADRQAVRAALRAVGLGR